MKPSKRIAKLLGAALVASAVSSFTPPAWGQVPPPFGELPPDLVDSGGSQGNPNDVTAALNMYDTHTVCKNPVGPKTVNVKEAFGFKADGIADDYDAFKRFSEAISCPRLPKGTTGGPGSIRNEFGRCDTGWTYVFPKGTYTMLRARSGVSTDIVYTGLTQSRFLGCGSTIRVGGISEIRPQPLPSGEIIGATGTPRFNSNGIQLWRGDRAPLRGLVFAFGSRLVVEGFILDGGADRIRMPYPARLSDGRPVDIVESGSSGLMTYSMRNYHFSRIIARNWETDGLYLGGLTEGARLATEDVPADPDDRIDADGYVENVLLERNGRNGASLIHAKRITLRAVTATLNGNVAPGFGGHAPRSGIVIEPNTGVVPSTPKTREISLLQVTVNANANSQIVVAREDLVGSVSIRKAIVDTVGSVQKGYSVRLNIPDVRVQDSTIQTRRGLAFIGCSSARWCPREGLLTQVRDSTFVSDANALKVQVLGRALLENNTFRGSLVGRDPVLLAVLGAGEVSRNQVLLDSRVRLRGGVSAAIFRSVDGRPNFVASENVFTATSRPSGSTPPFLTEYGGSLVVCRDRYPSLQRWSPVLKARSTVYSQRCP